LNTKNKTIIKNESRSEKIGYDAVKFQY